MLFSDEAAVMSRQHTSQELILGWREVRGMNESRIVVHPIGYLHNLGADLDRKGI
jgi:hypothetical protein